MSEMSQYTKQVVGLIKESGGLFNHPRIDYYEFRSKWLSLFNAASHDGLAPLGEWVQAVARGNPFMPVDVIKGGTIIPDPLYPDHHPDQPPYTTIEGGELMFTVPPILNNQIQVKLKDGKTVDSVAMQADVLSKRIAKAGENYLQNNLVNKLQIEVPVDPKLSEKMDAIFAHFGLTRTHHNDKVTERPKPIEITPDQQLTNDDFDYEF